MSVEAVERTNQELIDRLSGHGVEVQALEVCLHHPDGGPGGDPSLVGPCECRKPKPGMLLAALRRLGVAAGSAWMIGDSMDDLGAARAAGVKAALVFPLNRCQLCPLRDGPSATPDLVEPRFDEVARAILERDS